ncbi:MAG TPA: ATP synthase F1 subunit delta [Vicinamibacterales bacterium]|jgi:F-type H+-transporting ATPase subunit delta
MTSKTAASRYARALFDVALREGADLSRVEQELDGFRRLFDEQPTLKKVMLNPAVPVPRKRAAVVELTKLAQTSSIVAKLLALLAERDRLVLLPDLLAAYRERLLNHQKVVRAEVTTATDLPISTAADLQQLFARLTGRTVNLETRVDPAIIGGLVAKVGSTVYDASVVTQLQKMRNRLAENV